MKTKPFDIKKIQINIQSSHPEITLPVNNYINSLIEKMRTKYPRIERCDVQLKELKDKKRNFEVIAEVFIPGFALFASAHNSNIRLSVKLAFAKMQRSLAGL